MTSLSILKYICSCNSLISLVNENINEISDYNVALENIVKLGKEYYCNEKYITQHFDPWIYVAGYSATKEIFWDINTDSLNEIFVCFSYITYGHRHGYLRNFLGPICVTTYMAKKILYNIVSISLVANSNFDKNTSDKINQSDIVCRCNRADNFNPNIDKIDYIVYRQVVFSQTCKLRNKVKCGVSHSKVVVEIDGDLHKHSNKLLVKLRDDQVYYSANTGLLCDGYHSKKKKNHTKKPSTGFIALKMLLNLYPHATIHMYGFTFSGVFLHNWEHERSFCRNHERVVLH